MDHADEASTDDEAHVAATILDRARATLASERTHTLDEIAAETALSTDDLSRLFAAAQRLAVDDAYGEVDRTYARDLESLVTASSLEVVERELRLRLRFVTQIAVNDLSTIRLNSTLTTLLERGAEPDELGDQLAALAGEVVPAVERQLGADYRAALLRLLDTDVASQVAADTTRMPTMTVGFVDLVGFTRLSASTDPDGVGAVLTAFEDLASSTASAVGDVLLAKTIGDAVMFVGGSPDRVAWALLRTVEAEPEALTDVERRAGMAHGEVLLRDGDYVGTTVNTAARLTDLARPGTLVVSTEAAEALEEDWQQSRLPPRRLKGLGTSRPTRLRWPAEA
jgi:adenylate cyclase